MEISIPRRQETGYYQRPDKLEEDGDFRLVKPDSEKSASHPGLLTY